MARTTSSFRPTLSTLEGRDCPAVFATVTPTRELVVTVDNVGNTGQDVIVAAPWGNLTVNNAVLKDGAGRNVAASSITKVTVNGSDLANYVDLRVVTPSNFPSVRGPVTVNTRGGNDRVQASGFADRIDLGEGADSAFTYEGADTVFGGGGNDRIETYGGDDVVDAGAGNDYVDGGDGTDSVTGGDGDDDLRGGNGNDGLTGGNGNDRIDGGAGDDRVDGGAGDDFLIGGTGINVYVGGAGKDAFIGWFGTDRITDYQAGEYYELIEFGVPGKPR